MIDKRLILPGSSFSLHSDIKTVFVLFFSDALEQKTHSQAIKDIRLFIYLFVYINDEGEIFDVYNAE